MKVTPNYHFNGDCQQALELYQRAFKSELMMLMHYRDANPQDISVEDLTEKEKNYVYHAEMIIGSQRFMFSDDIRHVPPGHNISIVIAFENLNELKNAYSKLIDGGTVIRPLSETTYSRFFASLVDKFGMRWELMIEN